MTTAMASATIAAGESISTALDLSAGPPVAIYIPPTWKSAILTFQISGDGQFFGDLFDKFAKEISVNVEPGTVVQMDPANNRGAAYMKFRSGSRDSPTIQNVQQVFKIFLDRPGNITD
jgi:hypothetical protein